MGKHLIKRGPPVQCTCRVCDEKFVVANSRFVKGGGKFCSYRCMGISQGKPLPTGSCKHCGKQFIAKYRSQKNRKYCSAKCSAEASRGKTKATNHGRPYQYEKWMLAVLNRDLKCVECGAVHRLQAHHIKSWKSHPGLREDVENGVTLCGTCHHRKHPYLPAARFAGGKSLKCCVVCEQGFVVRRESQRTCSHKCSRNLKKQQAMLQRAPA